MRSSSDEGIQDGSKYRRLGGGSSREKLPAEVGIIAFGFIDSRSNVAEGGPGDGEVAAITGPHYLSI